MKWRAVGPEESTNLASLNSQLIEDEGHRDSLTVPELRERMTEWLTAGGYQAVLWEESGEPLAYALYCETDTEVYLRQFFVVRHRRRKGIGGRAIHTLFSEIWPSDKRWTVSVLVANTAALAFWRAMGYVDYDLTLEIMPEG